jgi:hypothetical protein
MDIDARIFSAPMIKALEADGWHVHPVGSGPVGRFYTFIATREDVKFQVQVEETW